MEHQDNINRNDMFSTQIWTKDIDHIDNEAIAKYLLAKEQEDTEGHAVSSIGGWPWSDTVGGWQSKKTLEHEITGEHPKITILNKLHTSIKEVMHEIAIYNQYKTNIKIGYAGMWANVNRYKDFNMPHVHPQCDWSGVYYVKTPEDCGLIRFADPRKINMLYRDELYQNVGQTTFHPDNKDDVGRVPKEGELIIFPAYLEHQVLPNRTDEPRISISFNIKIAND